MSIGLFVRVALVVGLIGSPLDLANAYTILPPNASVAGKSIQECIPLQARFALG